MSLEDAIKEVAKAIQSHADAIREDIAQRKADNAALNQLLRAEYEEGYSEDENEPAPVVSLAEKRKEKQAAEPLVKTDSSLGDAYEAALGKLRRTHPEEFVEAEEDTEVELDGLPGKTYADHSAAMDMSGVNEELTENDIGDEELTEDYVIECFKKAMLPKPGASQQENKARIREILKKYGCIGPLLKDGKVSVKPEKWAALTQELLS